jgi:EmrB/QacA subfamily drug resistance transporter
LAIYLVEFIILLDITIVVVALPSIGVGLGASSTELEWIVSSYALCLSMFTLSAGSVGDRYGRKRVFLTGVALFTAGSATCALAPTPSVLLGGRFAQGLGAALAGPGTLSLLTRAFPEPGRQARVVGGWGTIGGVAGVTGPVLGGALVQAFGWPAVFLVNVPLGLVAFLLAARYVPESADPARANLDPAGQLLGVLWLGSLAYGMINVSAHGWSAPSTLIPLAVAAPSAVAFVLVELWQRAPMLPIRLFADRRFTSANLASTMMAFTAYALVTFLPTYLQHAEHRSAAQTGLMLLPWPVAYFLGAHLAARWTRHVGPLVPMCTGLILIGLDMLVMHNFGAAGSYLLLAAMLAGLGIGVGLIMTPSSLGVMATVDPARAGTASAAVSAIRQTGTSLGIALLGVLFYQPDLTAGLHDVTLVAGLSALAAALLAALLWPKSYPASGAGRAGRSRGRAWRGAATAAPPSGRPAPRP